MSPFGLLVLLQSDMGLGDRSVVCCDGDEGRDEDSGDVAVNAAMSMTALAESCC